MCCSVNVSVCFVCCVLDSVCELFGETIRNVDADAFVLCAPSGFTQRRYIGNQSPALGLGLSRQNLIIYYTVPVVFLTSATEFIS